MFSLRPQKGPLALFYQMSDTEPGVVVLYDIRPGNGAGLFLQPRSPHGAGGALDHRPDTGSGLPWIWRRYELYLHKSLIHLNSIMACSGIYLYLR